jgi:hypothetical protein
MQKKSLWGALALLIALWGAATIRPTGAAQSVSVFVRRAQVDGVIQNGKVYSPIGALLKAFGCQWTAAGSTVQLTRGEGGGPSLNLKAPVFTFVTPDGKNVSSDALFLRGTPWVQVRPLAEALGGTYIATPSAGIVQVVFPTAALSQKDIERAVKDQHTAQGVSAAPLEESAPPSPSASPAEKGGETSGGTVSASPEASPKPGEDASPTAEEKDPVEVTNIDYSNPVIPGSKVPAELRGTATIKNTSDQRVTNVKFTVELKDLGGNPVASLPTKFISVLEPGESSSQDFLWYNYYNQTITPKVKIEHDPLPKKKKKDDSKKDDTTKDEAPKSDQGKKDGGK